MKKTFRNLLTMGIAAFSLSVAAVAEDHAQGEHDKGDATLEDVMDEMGGAFKKLARAMRAPKAADVGKYQAEVATMKKQALKAKDIIPTLAEEAGAQKATMVAAYQKSMKEFLAMLDNLEIVLAQGDLAKAQTVVNKLNTARKKGHEDFKKPDED